MSLVKIDVEFHQFLINHNISVLLEEMLEYVNREDRKHEKKEMFDWFERNYSKLQDPNTYYPGPNGDGLGCS